ncbi:toll-like receptor 3 [Agrilus planipennis]|uniref:Toll-like receptor 3 n=1 Tax=Agrilus planipennis TaxID=224129 RepID=A0A7F5RDD6_AGRPL|nr:toll-like receptor 3 [Agrilus planipennis]
MWGQNFVVLVLLRSVYSLWDADVDCHESCTCSLVHLTETSVYGFKNHFIEKQTLTESDFHLNNEVIYDDSFETNLENFLFKSVTCLLQTETNADDLLKGLPKDIQSLRFIQGFESGNKTISFSNFLKFEDLKIVELQGTNLFLGQNNDSFISVFDAFLPSLEYLNLENVHIKNSKLRFPLEELRPKEESVTFEFTQQLNSKLPPLTFVQKGSKEDEILPYKEYKHEEIESPLFIGFTNLQLLRVSNCKLNILKWEMFEGLHKLQHLILEKNRIMFLPDFVFYGIPNLKSLSLAWNNLLNIQVTDLAGLLELEYLDVSHNNFSQLSELSLPPFPKLKLADFKDNPITAVFPSTFEVLNTTDSLILGSTDTPMKLLPNSFSGLKLLQKLTLENVLITLLQRELLFGMPNLKELGISGNITKIEYDAFMETNILQRLILSRCKLQELSMDSFMGLSKLRILDLSRNNLQFLPPNVFDPLISLKELYLNENSFSILPRGIFSKIHPKLIRLTENPWHCSCHMDDWKPMVINKVKQKHLKICDFNHDKGVACPYEDRHVTKYLFDTKVAPKCTTPLKFKDWSVFHVMRKQLACPEFRPKLKKKMHTETVLNNTAMDQDELEYLKKKNRLHNSSSDIASYNDYTTNTNQNLNYNDIPPKVSLFPVDEIANNENNEINDLNLLKKDYGLLLPSSVDNNFKKMSDNRKMWRKLKHESHRRKYRALRKISTKV